MGCKINFYPKHNLLKRVNILVRSQDWYNFDPVRFETTCHPIPIIYVNLNTVKVEFVLSQGSIQFLVDITKSE